MQNKGIILIISGPSGCGKSTVLSEIYKKIPKHFFSISATTRNPRPGEVDDVDYHFSSKEKFRSMLERDEFLESAQYVGNYYGTPIKPIYDHYENGYVVILDIDVQGFRQVKSKIPEATSIFITPPSLEELEARLRARGTESEEKIRQRLTVAAKELEMIGLYDHVIVNDDVYKASEEILKIINNIEVSKL